MSSQPPIVDTTFRDLALALTDEERKGLLRKVSSALSLHRDATPAVVPSELSRDRRLELIREEISNLSLFEKLIFWFKKLLSAKSEEDTFVAYKLAGLRHRLRSAGLTVVAPHTISEVVAREVWQLYKAAYPLVPIYLDWWREGTYLQEGVEHLLSLRIPGARTDLYDFAGLEELQDTYLQTERKHDVRELVLKRLEEYLTDVPDEVFDHLYQGLLPIYHYRAICLFNYNLFFDVFGFDPGVVPPEDTPPFREAPTTAALAHIEQLYGALYAAARLPKDAYIHSELLDRYLEMKDAEVPEAAATDDAPDQPTSASPQAPATPDEESAYRDRQETVDELRAAHRQLGTAAAKLTRRIPFVELVRYYRNDPYYKLLAQVPKIKLKEFYSSYLTIRLLSQVDREFREIRRGVVSRLTKNLFGKEPPPFEYFRPGIQPATGLMGLPPFRHMKSLNVMYNFLRLVYHGRMQDMVRILSRILPIRQRDASSELVVHVAGLEDVHDQIRAFDYSFSPESDEGKAFLRIRYAMERDISQQRTYRSIVTQKDRESRALIDRGLEHVKGLERAFDGIRRSATDQLRERYASADSLVSRLDGLDNLLDKQLKQLAIFNRLIRQVIAGEEGY